METRLLFGLLAIAATAYLCSAIDVSDLPPHKREIYEAALKIIQDDPKLIRELVYAHRLNGVRKETADVAIELAFKQKAYEAAERVAKSYASFMEEIFLPFKEEMEATRKELEAKINATESIGDA